MHRKIHSWHSKHVSSFVFFVLYFGQVLSFLQQKEGFLSLVLKHIDISAMMDVLLRLISCVEPPPLRLETLTVCYRRTHIHSSTYYTQIFFAIMWHFSQQWLNEQKLAQRLIELIHPDRDEEVDGHFVFFFLLMSNVCDWKHSINSTRRFLNTFYRCNVHVCGFSLTEAVQCISDFVWHHSFEQRPGQSAPRDFTAGPFADCGRVVSLTNTYTCLPSLYRMLWWWHYSIVFLQAGVCRAAVTEYVFRREYWELYRQWYSSSSNFTGNKKACVSVRF